MHLSLHLILILGSFCSAPTLVFEVLLLDIARSQDYQQPISHSESVSCSKEVCESKDCSQQYYRCQ